MLASGTLSTRKSCSSYQGDTDIEDSQPFNEKLQTEKYERQRAEAREEERRSLESSAKHGA